MTIMLIVLLLWLWAAGAALMFILMAISAMADFENPKRSGLKYGLFFIFWPFTSVLLLISCFGPERAWSFIRRFAK